MTFVQPLRESFGMPMRGVITLHDNAHLYVVSTVQNILSSYSSICSRKEAERQQIWVDRDKVAAVKQ
jgi:hypothetical protein